MRISDWSSDVCSSDLRGQLEGRGDQRAFGHGQLVKRLAVVVLGCRGHAVRTVAEEHLVEVQLEDLVFAQLVLDAHRDEDLGDRKSVGSGKGVSVRVDLGGRRVFKKKITNQ